MPVPAILAILQAVNVGAMSIGTALGLIHHVHQADKNAKKVIKDITDPETKSIVQKKLEEFDWDKIIKETPPAPFYGGNAPNIKTLGGKSVLYDGNRSVSRWLWK